MRTQNSSWKGVASCPCLACRRCSINVSRSGGGRPGSPSHLRLVSIFGWGLLSPHHDPVRETAQGVVGGFNLKCLQVTLRAEQKAWDHRARSESDHWPLRFYLSSQHMAALAKLSVPGVTPSFLGSPTPPTPHPLPPPRLPAGILALQRHHHIL